MKKLTLLLSLLFTLLFTATPSSACTDARPTGSVGVGTNTYITGIAGTGGPSILVFWKYVGLDTLRVSTISLGTNTGITTVLGSGWAGKTAADRVVRVAGIHMYTSDGVRNFLRINGTHDLEFTGEGIANGALMGSPLYYRGVGGMLHSIKGGVGQSWVNPAEQIGRLEFVGTDNGSLVSGNISVVSSTSCDHPTAELGVTTRRSMLARSFVPELEAITRQWWES